MKDYTKLDLLALVAAMPCGFCDEGHPVTEAKGYPRHEFDHGHCFCPRGLKLTFDHTMGHAQPVFRTQWKDLQYTICAQCGKLMDARTTWIDCDGSQKHCKCLSNRRLRQIKKKERKNFLRNFLHAAKKRKEAGAK